MRIGIMEGRLGAPEEGRFQSFPRVGWAREFERAKAAGLDCIEWIYDGYGEDVNPLATDAGIAQMKALSAEHGVSVLSLCADYFMDERFLRCTEAELATRLAKLDWLLGRCQQIGINRVVLPFVDQSKIESDAELRALAGILRRALPSAERTHVELHLETALEPARFATLLDLVNHPLVKVNYDSGNSSGLGYDPREELAAYGPRVGSVHIKDRVLGGTTVALGTGSANFAALFESLRRVSYAGDFILQAARSDPDEVALARKNRAFIEKWLAS
jgi:L-ribulose-5-phosphate 3-epimerase